MFCIHKFQQTSAYFTPPCSEKFKVEGITNDTFKRLMFGFTIVVLKCEKCGDIQDRELLGNALESLCGNTVIRG